MTINTSITVSKPIELNTAIRDEMPDIVISNEISIACHWFIYTVVSQTVCTFGLGSNVINIICFIKQGFAESVNVSLLGLALSDIGCLLTMTVVNICFTPALSEADLPFDPMECVYLTGGMPHTTLTRLTGWFTALVTLERCLCITAPLKVRSIVTSKRMATLLLCVSVILIGGGAPVFIVNGLAFKFYPDRNKTLLGLYYTKDREIVERFSFAINNAFLPFAAFVIIIVCTIILVIILGKKSKWRNKSAVSAQSENVSTRSKRVAKMVVMISTLFIACFVPICFTFIGMCLVPEFSMYGKYRSLLFIIGGCGFVLESINSSVNIFIYYHMSSNYRQIFNKLFCLSSVRLVE